MPAWNCPQCRKEVREGARFCIHCGASLGSTKQTGDRSVAEATPAPSKTSAQSFPPGRIVFFVLAVIAFVGGGIAFFKSLPFHPHPVIESQPTIAEGVSYTAARTDMVPIVSRVEQGNIIISLQDVLQHRMVGFEYEGSSVPLSMVAFITPEGKLVTSIAFCEPCNSKRYHAQDDTLVCNACGSSWKLHNLEGLSGACQKYPPDPIPSVVVGDEIHIDESKVKSWKTRI